MRYKESITDAMTMLGKCDDTVFIGEGITNAGRIYNTLDDVPMKKCIEMPIAENLISGCGMGLAIAGFHPVIVFQRMDFMLIAADSIINHIALFKKYAGRNLPIIIRAIIGSQSKKFDVGEQHQHDFQHVFDKYIQTVAVGPLQHDARAVYKFAYTTKSPFMVIEEYDKYEKD